MIIDCIADLHGYFPKLEGGDLLIVAGDLTALDYLNEYKEFNEWIGKQTYKLKIVIGGNHDGYLEARNNDFLPNCKYLCDSGTEFIYEESYSPRDCISGITNDVILYREKKLKVYGSPWTKRFPGMNPDAMAFTVDTDKELATKWALIPDDTDILITHSPAWGFGDKVDRGYAIENVGSKSLAKWVLEHQNTLRLHVFGHIHEGYGIYKPEYCSPLSVNASHVNEYYKPVNKPIRVEL